MMPSSKSKTKHKRSVSPSLNVQFDFEAIGTIWAITLTPTVDDRRIGQLLNVIRQRIEEFDHNYSRFRADSLITKMAQQPGTYHLPDDAEPLFELYEELYELSEGRMTPLIGQTLVDAGYDANYSLKTGTLQPTPAWPTVLDYNFPNLRIKQPALLDLGAAGKGYLVDIVAQLISDAGITDFCVNAGGDMLERQTGGEPMQVGLEHPDHSDEAIGVVSLQNQSLCGSAGNRRVWGEFHHIIDPLTQTSPTQLKAVWVVAETTLLADALATALFFVEPSKLHEAYTFEYTMIHKNYSLERSLNFPAEFFTTNEQTKSNL
jgi:thiamine biosynthesis lipoprotein